MRDKLNSEIQRIIIGLHSRPDDDASAQSWMEFYNDIARQARINIAREHTPEALKRARSVNTQFARKKT